MSGLPGRSVKKPHRGFFRQFASDLEGPGFEPLDDGEEVVVHARKRAWARLLAKAHEIDPLVCPKRGWEDEESFALAKLPQFGRAELQSSAVIQDLVEIRDILAQLVKTGRAPPGFDPALLT